MLELYNIFWIFTFEKFSDNISDIASAPFLESVTPETPVMFTYHLFIVPLRSYSFFYNFQSLSSVCSNLYIQCIDSFFSCIQFDKKETFSEDCLLSPHIRHECMYWEYISEQTKIPAFLNLHCCGRSKTLNKNIVSMQCSLIEGIL